LVECSLLQGSSKADYPPPLFPLEPYAKPANPFGPPELLPQLCPNFTITGSAYTKEGSFSEGDIIALPGRDDEVPAVNNWDEFLEVSVICVLCYVLSCSVRVTSLRCRGVMMRFLL
jgi:hypothetical protein